VLSGDTCRQHPCADRPLIDWDLILIMEPATMVGAVIGSFLTKLLPTWLTTLLLSILLIVMSSNLWKKARTSVSQENASARSSVNHDVEEASEVCPLTCAQEAAFVNPCSFRHPQTHHQLTTNVRIWQRLGASANVHVCVDAAKHCNALARPFSKSCRAPCHSGGLLGCSQRMHAA
jgi:hypothetical protein